MADNPLRKQPRAGSGRPFKKGESGNPRGRTPGTRNHATKLAELLLDGEAGALFRTVINLAKEGDVQALRLCLERILPPRKSRPIEFDLPVIDKPEDIAAAIGALATAMSKGQLSPEDATAAAAILELKTRALWTSEMEARLRAVEGKTK